MKRAFTVAVDARVAVDEVPRGIGKTTLALYAALAAARPGWRFRLFCRTTPAAELFPGLANVSVEPLDMPGDRFDLWPRVRLPAALVAARPDVFHAPAGPAVWPAFAPLVTTVHDLIPVDEGRADPAARAWWRGVRSAARRARVVLTPSEHAKSRVVALCRVPAAKVVVVPHGPISAPAAPPNPERLADLRAAYGVPAGERHVLHFGMADPRKRTAHLLSEWERVPAAVRAGVTLVVVGVHGPALGEFRALAGPGVRVHGYCSEPDARDLLAGAAVLAYPTAYEGFGMPLLDAFAAGTPAVAGDRTSVPEVAGNAAELVDPFAPGAVAAGLTRVLSDAGHAAELRRRGRARAEQFTWARAAEAVAGVFETR